MKITDKYILRQLIVGFLLVLTCLTMLVWLTQSLRMIDMIVSKGVGVWIFIEMTLLVLPKFMQILMPLALFAVVMFTFIRMQSDKELMVLKAVGMSPSQLMRPVLKMATFLILIGYILSFFVTPWATTMVREMRWKIQNNLSHVLLQEGQFNTFKKGMMVYIRERLPDGAIKGVLAYEIKNGKKSVLIADEGTLYQTPDGLEILFGQGVRQEYDPKNQGFSVLKFDKYTITLNDSHHSGSSRVPSVQELPFMYLLTVPKDKVIDHATWRKYKVEAFKRMTQPLYNLVFALLALVGVLTGHYNRRGQSGRINFVVGAALFIQVFALMFENLSGKNLWAIILMCLNIIVPVWVIYRVFQKEEGPRLKKMPLKCLILLLCSLMSCPVWAVSKIDTSAFNKEQPVDFEADHVSYNQHNQIMTASGNVVLKQNGILFTTDKIIYNQEKDLIHIPGQAKMVLPDGNSSIVHDIQMKAHGDEVATGKGIMDMADGTHLWANQVIRQNKGTENILKDAYYTPCDMCEGSTPLWQLHATSVEQDDESHMMRFWNTFLEIKDIPVFYFPYFQTPDYTVKRKTGFLTPGFGSGSELKTHIELPFFVNIAPNQNLTITPMISFTRNPLGMLDYQGLFTKGKVNLKASFTVDKEHQNQGHIESDFEYDIDSSWRVTGSYNRSLTDTYFRRYNVLDVDQTQSYLTSHLGTEYYGNRVQGEATFYNFQSLQDGVSSKTIPVILPVFNAHYTTLPFTEDGGVMFSDINGAFINTRRHFKSNRISLTQGIQLPYRTSWGLSTELSGTVRMDGYSVDTGEDGIGFGRKNDSYFTGRIFPQAVLKIGYPLIQKGMKYTQVLEPIVMLVVGPNGSNSDKIPNVDSTVFDFDDANLFSANRYVGYDRVESGSRINYGVQWTLYQTGKNRSIQALLGQSVRLRNETELDDAMGYEHHFSSYVGRLRLNYEYLSLAYRFRFSEHNLEPQKNDISLQLGGAPLSVGIDYLFQDSFRMKNIYSTAKKEISIFAKSRLTKNWSAEARHRYNLLKPNRGALETYGVLRYDNECTAVELVGKKSYTYDRNYRGSTSISVRFYLKTIGGFGQ